MFSNPISIMVGKVPGDLQPLAIEPGTSIGNVLDTVGIKGEGYEIRLNGTKVDEEATVNTDNSRIFLCKVVKGA